MLDADQRRDVIDASDTAQFAGSPHEAHEPMPMDRLSRRWMKAVINGRYRLVSSLGNGGMGAVFRAVCLDTQETFAVKVIDTRVAGGVDRHVARVRAEREAAALAELDSPHVVRLRDFVNLDANCVALVMDFADGPTLQEVMDTDGPLALSRIANLMAQLANALVDVHQHGLVHRDLKPANLVVEELGDGSEFIHLLDFGIVRQCGYTRITKGFLGTPIYISPEQVRGEVAGPTTDIYTFGAILYHLLRGRPPFVESTAMQLLNAHLNCPVEPLAPTSGRGEPLPVALCELVEQMLSKNPDERSSSMVPVATLLEELCVQCGASGGTASTLRDWPPASMLGEVVRGEY